MPTPPMSVYVRAKSKADANRRLAAGEVLQFTHYGMRGYTNYTIDQLEDNTIVKVYQTIWGGSPVAKSYGVIKKDKIA